MENQNYMQVSGSETKKGKSAAIIAGVCAVVIAAGAAVSYAFVPAVKNTVRMAVMKPSDYFSTVQTENLRDMSRKITESYQKSYDYYQADTLGADISLSVVPDEPYEIYDGMEIKNAALGIDGAFSKDVLSEDITININDVEVADISAVIDIAANEMFMKIPGLSDDFLKMDSDDLSYYDFSSLTNVFTYERPAPEQVENILNKYGDILISGLEGCETSLEKGAEGDSAGVSYKYNKICIEVSEKKLDEIAVSFLETMRDDEEIKNIYDSYIEAYEELEYAETTDYVSEINDSINELKADMETDSDENSITISILVDAEGTVRGHEISDEDHSFGYSIAKFENNYGIEFIAYNDDEEAGVTITASESDNAYTGVCSIIDSSEDTNLSIGFENLKFEDNEKKLASGTLSIDLSSIDDSLSEIKLILSAENDVQKMTLDIPEYADISMDYSIIKNPEVAAIPDKSVNIDDFADEETNEKFLKDIFDKLGWDYDSLFSTPDYDDDDDHVYPDYDYYDDYDYDDTDYDDTTDSASYDYKLADADVKINGNPVLMPAALPEIYNLTYNDSDSYSFDLTENSTCSINSDGNLCAIFEAAADSVNENTPVSYLAYQHILSTDPPVEISVNGIKIGSSVSAAADAFGIPSDELTLQSLSADVFTVYLNDTENSSHYIALQFENTMLTGITLNYGDDM